MKSNKNFKNDYLDIINSFQDKDLKEIENDELDTKPDNLTRQQRLRDRQITSLLTSYVDAYKKKSETNNFYKKLILFFCITILGIFTVAISISIINFLSKGIVQLESLVGLIVALISFVSLFIGILKIITEYIFPKNEEQYITKIVELIQTNDLENKKADKSEGNNEWKDFT